MEFNFIKDYKDQESLRRSFSQLALDTFGIHFESWYEKGYWNDSYICYSYFDGERIASNVSVNKMHLTWEGKVYNAIQIGTVMTDPDYRNQGLAYRLLEKVMFDFENEVDFIYLFGNDLALNLYKKFDMHEFHEHRYFSDLPKHGDSKFRKLDLKTEADLKLMEQMAENRLAQSDGIGIDKDIHLVMFYSSLSYYDDIYYSDDLNCIVIMEESEETLHLYEVISEELKDMHEIMKALPVEKAKKVEFHFKPKGIDLEEIKLNVEDQTLLIRHKDLNPKETFRFSAFSHA